ncbi:MAG: NUDIX domain-containing protein [Spirochaetales bacterium]|nr:NUDIX domain-containing protein [Spirochaetales bacterium]
MTEEWLPLVDTMGRIIGKAERKDCHKDPGLLHPVIHLHVFNNKGQIYLQKRAKSKDLLPGYWDTSVGGHIAQGESVMEALNREAVEELGIEAAKAEPLYTYIWKTDVESEFVYTFRLVHNGAIRINREEIEDGRFFYREKIEEMRGLNIITPNFGHEFMLLKEKHYF